MKTPSDHASSSEATPPEVIATVARVVTAVTDRITGDRVDYPLLVSSACVEALKQLGVKAQVMYGQVAWIEILEDQTVVWAGCWGNNHHFWVATQFGEVVDLNTSVAHRKRAHSTPHLKPLYSPPMLWSREIPKFYRFAAEGVAELELHLEEDRRKYELVLREIREKCRPELIAGKEPQFPNEPILCPGRKLLDDSHQTFRHFDRALSVHGIPDSPF
jgi:hypothetical protein